MKALVTGGGGFIGSNVVRALLERGDDVRVLDNFSTGSARTSPGSRATSSSSKASSAATSASTTPFAASRSCSTWVRWASVPRSVQDPLTSSAVNVEGTLNVLLAARDEGVRRVVFASSSSIYGNQPELPLRESHGARPDLAVRRREARGRALLRELRRVYAFETVVAPLLQRLRPAPRPDARSTPRSFRSSSRRSRPASRSRSSTTASSLATSRYVDNVVAANLLAADAEGVERADLQRLGRLAGDASNELADSIGQLLDKPVDRRYLPPRPGDLRDSWADVSDARHALGFEPPSRLEDGLRRTVEFLLERKD